MMNPKLLFSLVSGAALMLSACGTPDIHVMSTGTGVQEGRQLTWAQMPDGWQDDAVYQMGRQAIENALRDKGYSFGSAGKAFISMGLAERPAKSHVDLADGLVTSPAQKGGMLRPCGKTMLRLTLSVAEAASGSLLYQGSAQKAHCKGDMATLSAELAQAFADDMSAADTE